MEIKNTFSLNRLVLVVGTELSYNNDNMALSRVNKHVECATWFPAESIDLRKVVH